MKRTMPLHADPKLLNAARASRCSAADSDIRHTVAGSGVSEVPQNWNRIPTSI